MPVTVDGIVHHGQEGIGIHALILAHLFHGLVTEPEVDAEASQTLQEVIVVGNQTDHLIVGLIHFLISHTRYLFLITACKITDYSRIVQ